MVMRAEWVCLMYHDIAAGAHEGGGGPSRFAVPEGEFGRQLDQLRELGLQGVTLREALAGKPSAIAITFDDGDAGQYTRGFRALAARGMQATFFVTTDWIGRDGYVSWPQLREMRAAGMDVQSHAQTHRFLSELTPAQLRDELRGAKAALDDGLAQNTDMLALPGGDWPRRPARNEITAAGYRVVATSAWGVNASPAVPAVGPVIVHRCTVSGVAGPRGFAAIATADRGLRRRRRLREGTLGALRSTLGPSRYARWRRLVLDALAGRGRA